MTRTKETIDAIARFQNGTTDAQIVTKALRYAFGKAAPAWVNGRYVGVKS